MTNYDKCLKYGHTWEWCDHGTFSEFEADFTCRECGATAYVTGDVRTADLRYIEYDLEDGPLMGDSTRIYEEMMERIGNGEFGAEPNIADVVRVMAEEVNKPSTFVNITGLWAGRGGKVAYKGRTKEEITIPSGSEVIVFHNDKQNESQPDLNLVYVD